MEKSILKIIRSVPTPRLSCFCLTRITASAVSRKGRPKMRGTLLSSSILIITKSAGKMNFPTSGAYFQLFQQDSEEFVNVFLRISFGSTIELVSFDESQVVTFYGKFACGFRNSDYETGSQSDNMVGSPHGFIIYWIIISKNIKQVTKVFDVENWRTDNSRVLRWVVSLIEWNSSILTVRYDATYEMSWKALMNMMTKVYCPRNEIQKPETELWDMTVKGIDVVGYTQRFQELALLCPRMVPEEEDKEEEEEESSKDDDDDEEKASKEDEEEEHLAPTDSIALPAISPVPLVEETKPFKIDESAPTPPPPRSPHSRVPFSQTRLRRAWISVRPHTPPSPSTEALIITTISIITLASKEDEEEEHLASADSIALPAISPVPLVEETKPFKINESAPTPPPPRSPHSRVPFSQTRLRRAWIFVRPHTPPSPSTEALIITTISIITLVILTPTDTISTLTTTITIYHTSPPYADAPLGYKAAMVQPLCHFERELASLLPIPGMVRSEDRRTTLEASIKILEAQVRTLQTQHDRMEWQRQQAGYKVTIAFRRIHALKARDRARTGDAGPQDGLTDAGSSLDKIQNYVKGRFICAHEAYSRILKFDIHHSEPVVQILAVHLKDMQ
nr:reverse transcriptase domain-containing protein [Tanacetum cinerariifolium]